MTTTRARTVTLGIAAIAVAVGAAAGCSSSSPTTAPTSQPVRTVVVTETRSPTATPTPTSTSTTATTDTAPSGAAGDRCAASQLSGTLAAAPGGASAGSEHYVLTLSNRSSSPCTVAGYPGVSFVGDGNGTQLGAPARRDGGADRTVTLQPTDSARAALTVAQAANFPDCSPQTADGLRVYPPDDRDSLFVRAGGLTACRSDAVLLTVGPLR